MRRADQREFHYLYKITRFDNKFYFGIHSTDDLEDGYFGSGTYLCQSVNKHGREKHTKEIVAFFETRQASKNREKEIVDLELLKDPQCMNLAPGGGGGFCNEEHQRKCSIAGNNSPNRNQKLANERRQVTFESRHSRSGGRGGFAGKTHSLASKNKMSESMQGKQIGEKNSQFGSCWVTNGAKPIKIKKEFLDEYLSDGYSRGRKCYVSVTELV